MLPSLDFDIEVVENLKARFSYSKTIARAQYDQMRAAVNVDGPDAPDAHRGHADGANIRIPALVPLESENFDLSFEWYFGDSSYVAAGVFEKRVVELHRHRAGASEQFFGLRDVTSGPACPGGARRRCSRSHPAHTRVARR